jgi:lipoprotein-releasing system permease protein
MLLRLGERYQGFHIQLKDAFDADNWIENQAKIIFPQYQWRSWISSMGTLFKAMSMEKIIVSFLLSVIIAVAAFNIVASLVLMVSDKRKDIAVMRTMGADSLLISKVFIMQGMSVGVIGILIGVVTGSSVAYFIGDIIGFFEKISGLYLFDPSIYLISVLPSEILVYDILRIICGAIVISFLATLYPAWRAGQILPAEALRYDQ